MSCSSDSHSPSLPAISSLQCPTLLWVSHQVPAHDRSYLSMSPFYSLSCPRPPPAPISTHLCDTMVHLRLSGYLRGLLPSQGSEHRAEVEVREACCT